MMKRRKSLNDELSADIKRLGKLDKDITLLKAEMSNLQVEAVDITDRLANSLQEGDYTVGRWLLNVNDKLTKGRVSPSWKGIAETVQKAIPIIKQDLIGKLPEHTSAFRKFAAKMAKTYDDAYQSNTKVGDDTTKTNVSISRIASKN